ncbi:hypothetical protein L596_028972 [Steinernema carpocapsae]|uniref:Peptidase A1 domain-containing protein n=1 Tax=Steinernema carpocapsae TaxID=34508 RepID=A0A4U5LT84_STECR|nr:hypothetical protein L596_028972 [Steinernema carpocapsae]
MRRFVLLTSLLLSAVSPLTEAGKSIPLRIVRSPLPPAGRSSEGYKHPWYEYVTADISFGSTRNPNFPHGLLDDNLGSRDQLLQRTPCRRSRILLRFPAFDVLPECEHGSRQRLCFVRRILEREPARIPVHLKGRQRTRFLRRRGRLAVPARLLRNHSFWLNALKDNEPKNQFGIFVSHDGQNSFLRFGGPLLASQCDLSSLQWFSLSSDKYWQTPISGFNFGGYKRSFNQHAIMDTGSGWLGLPGTYLMDMMNRNDITYDQNLSAYTVDCRRALSLPILELTIGGRVHKIFPSAYVDRRNPQNVGGTKMCVVNLKNSRKAFGADWTFGLPFMQSYCSSYDYDNKRIGFANNMF